MILTAFDLRFRRSDKNLILTWTLGNFGSEKSYTHVWLNQIDEFNVESRKEWKLDCWLLILLVVAVTSAFDLRFRRSDKKSRFDLDILRKFRKWEVVDACLVISYWRIQRQNPRKMEAGLLVVGFCLLLALRRHSLAPLLTLYGKRDITSHPDFRTMIQWSGCEYAIECVADMFWIQLKWNISHGRKVEDVSSIVVSAFSPVGDRNFCWFSCVSIF